MNRTHTVTNQVPPLLDYDVSAHPLYTETLQRVGAAAHRKALSDLGRRAGSAEAIELGDRAERHHPVLRTHDRFGHRIDQIEYDPAYHDLMTASIGAGLAGAPWASDDPHAHLVRAIGMSVWGQVDAGHLCPVSMTYAAIPALRANPALAARFEPRLTSTTYDHRFTAPTTKHGLTAGMSMTEKQGGSDVRDNTTYATPDGSDDDGDLYRLTGHKWFTSAPMSDLLLTLAQTPGGLTCVVVPRVLPDGTANAVALQRLKDKLGNRSNASSEIEYHGALAWRLGDEGRGVPTIIEMVNMTRLDCTLASAGGMRTGVQAAVHHARHRRAFGRALIDQPLMRNVLADLAIEAEASTLVALWLADLTDRVHRGDAAAAPLRRIALAVSKYFVCKRGPIHAAEALECFGGNGYIEDSRMPRLFRESPLMSIWEGSGNVAALDALRALGRQPDTLDALLGELAEALGVDARYDRFVRGLAAALADPDTLEFRARRVVGDLALALQAGLLLRYGHAAVAAAFCATRLDHDWGSVFGTLPAGLNLDPILERAGTGLPE